MLSIVNLEKQHFRLITDFYNGRNQEIQITHPDFLGRGGWVLFFDVMCNLCQDTKTTWFAVGIVRGQNYGTTQPFPARTYIRKGGVQRFPTLKYVTKTGMVVDSPPSAELNVDPRTLINFACKQANLGSNGCCQFLPRSQCH